MDDDFDTAGALSVLFEVVREGNTRLDAGEAVDSLVAAYDDIVGVLGLEEPAVVLDDLTAAIDDLAARFGLKSGSDPSITIDRLVDERTRARAEKDWARSDEIRDGLVGIGIQVEDASGGTRWHRQ
jgi:cysteinyl-tRNA synthetase